MKDPKSPARKTQLFKDKIPPLHPVKSTNLRSVGYSEADGRMFVSFKAANKSKNDTLYCYECPEEVYLELRAAKSHGSYFSKYVRDRYPVKRVVKELTYAKKK